MNQALFDESTSKSLIVALRLREMTAWATLAELYGPLIIQWCRQMGADHATAQDVSQEVLIRVIQKVDMFRQERPSDRFRSWLFTMTRNVFLGDVKKQSRGRLLPSDVIDGMPERADSVVVDPELSHEQESALIRRAFEIVCRSCSKRTRDIFVAAIDSHRESRDIANEFRTTPGNVRKIRSVYLAKIRDLIELTDDCKEISED